MTNHAQPGGAFGLLVLPLMGALLCLSWISNVGAAMTSGVQHRFVGQAITDNAERAGRIEIFIERWSTEQEVDRLRQPLLAGHPGDLLTALRRQPSRIGVVLLPGVQAHGARVRTQTPRDLLFAIERVTASGRHIIAASDEHIGLGESRLEARESISEFNLIDIRFGPDGNGVGKVVAASDVSLSEDARVPEVKNYAAHPVKLIDVRAEAPQ